MIKPRYSPYLVPFDGSFRVADAPTTPPPGPLDKKALRKARKHETERIEELQRKLYAADRHSLLLIFQAMDAAGKDSTIRAVTSGVNPAGFQVFSFKRPSEEALDHDFLWRTSRRLPERGRIGIFNRSYYEEALVVRVHPAILAGQKLPDFESELHPERSAEHVWQERFESFRDHEKHLARNGTVILKFWLNVSKEEQRLRFLARIREPEKNWKFSAADVRERGHWDAYMRAYEELLNETSRPHAPWYAIPADSKPYMRLRVAELIAQTLDALDLDYPRRDPEDAHELEDAARKLEAEA